MYAGCEAKSPKRRKCHSLIEGPLWYSWFIVTMGTGVVSILLHQLPYNGRWLRIIADIFFVLNICLFVIFSIISLLRYTMYPELFPTVLRHPHQSLFLGTFPVGLATIIDMIVLVCVPAWGHGMAILAWVLWWIDSVIALAICFHLTWVMLVLPNSHIPPRKLSYLLPFAYAVLLLTELTECQTGEASWRK